VKYRALATDYDGTIAHDGIVDEPTMATLRRLRDAGVRLLLVTGRELPSLFNTFADAQVFDRIVAENGALLYDPATTTIRVLATPPPPSLIDRLQQAGVPLSVGHSIVATVAPYEREVRRAIHELGLPWHVVLNKEAVMALPSEVTKATGLAASLRDLHIAPEQTLGVGDAENDQAFLRFVGLSAAVANALGHVKALADITTTSPRGAGVSELIERLLSGELEQLVPDAGRHAMVPPRSTGL